MIKVAFLLSQGSVTTHSTTCDGKHDKGFVADVLLSPRIKKFENRPTTANVINE